MSEHVDDRDDWDDAYCDDDDYDGDSDDLCNDCLLPLDACTCPR